MAISVTRPPHEQYDQYKKAIDMMFVIQEIVKNPNVAQTMKEISKSIIDCHTISEERKRELLDAEETLAQAREVQEDIAKAKKTHEDKVSEDLNKISDAQNNHKLEVAKFEAFRTSAQDSLEKHQKDADIKLDVANQVLGEAKAQHKETQDLKAGLEAAQKSHTQAVEQFEDDKAAALAEIDAKLAAHEEIKESHKANVTAFELRKKRFEDALKG